MKIFQVFLTVLLLFCFLHVANIHAADFNTDANVAYSINESGKTAVLYTINIENANEVAMQKGYDLALSGITPSDLAATEDGRVNVPEIKGSDRETHVIIHFQKPVTGVKKKKTITISFASEGIAQESGEIWELLIPKLVSSENFRNYNVTLGVPNSFGDEGYIIPHPNGSVREEVRRVYTFTKEQLKESGVTATFGKFQVFSFNLSYHLKNSSWKWTKEEIAIPPDTSVQKVYLESVEPKPVDVHTDEDGNWILKYSMNPYTSVDVTVKGKAQLFASPRRLFSPKPSSLSQNTKETYYWQANDPKIRELAKELKTPEAIYNYVVNLLSYNYDRVTPEVERLGARKVLDVAENAICMEFTDLFIAIARARGIPAREINGFAQSDNPKVQPLSLVSDVLHSWPEYWDEERGVWIAIDPTWGKTTGGKDYFSTFDLKHVAFVIHGNDDTHPFAAGSYKQENDPQKDVFVALDTLGQVEPGKTDVAIKQNGFHPFGKSKWNLTISNTGSTALYDQLLQIMHNGMQVDSHAIAILPPQSKMTFQLEAPIGIFANDQPNEVIIYAGGKTMELPMSKMKSVLIQIVTVLGGILGVVAIGLSIIYKKRIHFVIARKDH